MAQPLRLVALLLFLAFPILEIGLLIRAGQAMGFWRLALIVVATAMLGAAVIRHTGLAVLTRARAQLERRRSGFEPLFDGLVQLTAGMLLIFPGLISDCIGLILLVPAVRNVVVTRVLPKLFTVAVFGTGPASGRYQRTSDPHEPRPAANDFDPESGGGVTIEGEYERVSEKSIDPERSLKPRPPRRSAH
jgi:UPF0716 protein FxsA